ncbi:twin-arginine translocation signal domain-containing protein [Erwinia aphidicola]
MERREFIAKSALALIASGIGAGASSSLLASPLNRSQLWR